MEYFLLLLNLSYGYILGFILRFIRYKKISPFKDILYSVFYIYFYIILIDKVMIKTNPYLVSMLIIGFIIGYKYYYKNSIKEFYELLTLTKKITIKILKPPFIAMIYKAIKNHKAKKIYYKKHPYLKKNKYELF